MHEIDEVVGEADPTYEQLQSMPYMDMVLEETLRLYPPAPRVDRRCTQNYTIPGTKVVIEKGTKVVIPIYRWVNDASLLGNKIVINLGSEF